MCCFIASVEDADSFVAGHLRRWPVAEGRDIPFGDGPLFSDRCSYLLDLQAAFRVAYVKHGRARCRRSPGT